LAAPNLRKVNFTGVYLLNSEFEELLALVDERLILSRIITFCWSNNYGYALPTWMADHEHFQLLLDLILVNLPHNYPSQ
jgi:hypothetical protein